MSKDIFFFYSFFVARVRGVTLPTKPIDVIIIVFVIVLPSL